MVLTKYKINVILYIVFNWKNIDHITDETAEFD